MDVDEGGVSSPSQPSGNPLPMDGMGSNDVHAPAHGFSALLHEAPDHQDLRGNVGDPGGLTLSTPPPANEEDYSQFWQPELFDFRACGLDEWRDREPCLEDLPELKSLDIYRRDLLMRDPKAFLEISELECHLGIHNQRGWGHPESYLKRLRWESDEKKVKEQEEARKVSRKRNPDVSETDSAFRRARNPFMFASYGKTVELL